VVDWSSDVVSSVLFFFFFSIKDCVFRDVMHSLIPVIVMT